MCIVRQPDGDARLTLNQRVQGSSPWGLTDYIGDLDIIQIPYFVACEQCDKRDFAELAAHFGAVRVRNNSASTPPRLRNKSTPPVQDLHGRSASVAHACRIAYAKPCACGSSASNRAAPGPPRSPGARTFGQGSLAPVIGPVVDTRRATAQRLSHLWRFTPRRQQARGLPAVRVNEVRAARRFTAHGPLVTMGVTMP
jgi:hypothetical protein